MKGDITLWTWIALCLLQTSTVRSSSMSSQNTCGGAFQGSLSFHEFTGIHSHHKYEINTIYMKVSSFHYQQRFCSYKRAGQLAKFTDIEKKQDIILEIMDGKVIVEFISNGETMCTYSLENSTVSDGSSYAVDLKISGDQLNFGLISFTGAVAAMDAANISSCRDGNFSSFLHLEIGGEVTDGHGSSKPSIFKNFIGCSASDAIINEIPLLTAANLTDSSDVDDDDDNCHFFGHNCTAVCPLTYVHKGTDCVCPDHMKINEFGLCVPSCECLWCANGSSCNVTLNGKPQCVCLSNFEGPLCDQVIDPCLDFECFNDGWCEVNSNSGFRKAECRCPLNISGEKCEQHVNETLDPCQDSPCRNNGTCERDNSTADEIACACSQGYDGKFCETETDINLGTLNWNILVGIILGSIIGLLGIFGFLYYLCRIGIREQSSVPPVPKAQETGAQHEGAPWNHQVESARNSYPVQAKIV